MRTIFTILILSALLIYSHTLYAQPANDDCENAIMIELGVPFAADNTGATADDIPLVGGSCGDYQVNDASDPGVFFSFVAPGGPVNIIYTGASDARLVVLSGTCDTELFCVATMFQTGGTTIIADLMLNPGETYLVVIDPLSGGEGMFMVESCISALVCNDLTVYLDDTGVETISPLDLVMAATCDMTDIVASQTTFDCADVAASPINVMVTQGQKNCVSVVTIRDTVSPLALCKEVTIELDEEGNGSIGGTNSAPVTQITGMLDGMDPTFNRPIGGPGSCIPSGSNVFYETFSFSISAADVYTFAFSGPADLTAALYGGGFNPALPCANILAYNDDGNGNLDPLIIIQLNLVPGDYTMVTSTFSNGETSAYTMDISSTNGGRVFAAGAIEVPLIDNGSTDACGIATYAVSQEDFTCDNLGPNMVTLTVTDVNGNSSSCTSIVTVISELPCGWTAPPDGINCIDGSSVSHNPTNNVFSLTSENCYYTNPFNSDATAFAQYSLCGDGSITAQVTGISGTALGWAGVTMRETNAAGAKKAQLTTNMSNFSRREFRVTTNGTAFPQQFPSQNRRWLRIVRSGNQFAMYVSPNGVNWAFAGAQNIQMNSCIEIGLVVTNYTSNSTVTATFANVSVIESNQPLMANSGDLASFDFVEDRQSLRDVKVFPNPTSGQLNVALAGYEGRPVTLEVYNTVGQLFYSRKVDEVLNSDEIIDLSSVANGMYLIRVSSDGLPAEMKRVTVAR